MNHSRKSSTKKHLVNSLTCDSFIGSILNCHALYFISRLAKAFAELEDLLKNEKDLEEVEQYRTAKVVLEDARQQLPQSVS